MIYLRLERHDSFISSLVEFVAQDPVTVDMYLILVELIEVITRSSTLLSYVLEGLHVTKPAVTSNVIRLFRIGIAPRFASAPYRSDNGRNVTLLFQLFLDRKQFFQPPLARNRIGVQ